jgi:prepilin-type N-terminal cleavage/methylation domain-containing protein
MMAAMNAQGSRAGERGMTIMEMLLVLALVALLLALALPNFHAARIRNDEAAAVATLREIGKAQEIFRLAALVDEDGDGHGEYALLGDLAGKSPSRGRTVAIATPLPQLGLLLDAEGEADLCGYRIRLLMPGPKGAGVRENAAGPATKLEPKLSGSFWCAYAWPLRREGFVPAATGRRTFFINQAGELLACDGDYHALPLAEGGPTPAPEPGAAFAGPGPLGTISGAPALGTVGRDGLVWRMVE